MGPIKEALRENVFPAISGGGVNTDFRKILGHSFNNGGLGIPYPQFPADVTYNTYKVSSGRLVDSLLGGAALNCLGHRACIFRAPASSF